MRLRTTFSNLDAVIACLSLAALLGTIVVQVVLRFFFKSPLMGAEEFTRYTVIFLVMTPLAFAERTRSHVVMEEIQAGFPVKIRMGIRLLIDLLTTVVYAIVALSSISVLINNARNETATLRMPFWLFFLPTVAGMVLLTLTRAHMLVRRSWKEI
jgi:TRAP-type C4-dicarboxylate transport system permease small subunit